MSQILNTETSVIISGKTSVRDDRVSIFIDSIMPLAKWVANVAKIITIDVRDKSVLPDVKKALVSLPHGNTKVVLNLYSEDKSATLVLKNTVELGPTTAKDLTTLGIKVDIE